MFFLNNVAFTFNYLKLPQIYSFSFYFFPYYISTFSFFFFFTYYGLKLFWADAMFFERLNYEIRHSLNNIANFYHQLRASVMNFRTILRPSPSAAYNRHSHCQGSRSIHTPDHELFTLKGLLNYRCRRG